MVTKAISHVMSFSDVKLDTCHHLLSLTLKWCLCFCQVSPGYWWWSERQGNILCEHSSGERKGSIVWLYFKWWVNHFKRVRRYLIIKLIVNRWAWERCLWKQVVVQSEMWASIRVPRYPPQGNPESGTHHKAPSHWETQWRYLPTTIFTKASKGGGVGEAWWWANYRTKQDLELKRTAQLPRVSACHLKLGENSYVK